MRDVLLLLSLLSVIIMNGCSSQMPASVVSLPPYNSSKSLYTVKANDTIYSIARAQGIDYQTLVRINKIPPPFAIYVGQKLLLRESNISNAQAIAARKRQSFNISVAKGNLPKQTVGKQTKNKQYTNNVVGTQSTNITAAKKHTTVPMQAKDPTTLAIQAAKSNRATWIWPVKGPILARFSAAAASKKNGLNIGGNTGTLIKAVASGRVVYSGSGLRGYGNLIIIKHANNFLSAYAHNKTNMVQEGVDVKIGQHIAEMGSTGTNKVMLHFEIRHNGRPVNPEKILPGQ